MIRNKAKDDNYDNYDDDDESIAHDSDRDHVRAGCCVN